VGFVASVTALDCYVFFWCLFLLIRESIRESSFISACSDNIVAVVLIVITFCFAWCLCGLSGYHCYLVSMDLTTNEQIKGRPPAVRPDSSEAANASGSPPPGSCTACCLNTHQMWARPPPYSKVKISSRTPPHVIVPAAASLPHSAPSTASGTTDQLLVDVRT